MGFMKKLRKKLKKAKNKVIPKSVRQSGLFKGAKTVVLPLSNEDIRDGVSGVLSLNVPESMTDIEIVLQKLFDEAIAAVELAQKAAEDSRFYAAGAAKEAARAASDAAELRSIMVEFKRCKFCKKIFCQCPGGN
jgi:hypothetical protein